MSFVEMVVFFHTVSQSFLTARSLTTTPVRWVGPVDGRNGDFRPFDTNVGPELVDVQARGYLDPGLLEGQSEPSQAMDRRL